MPPADFEQYGPYARARSGHEACTDFVSAFDGYGEGAPMVTDGDRSAQIGRGLDSLLGVLMGTVQDKLWRVAADGDECDIEPPAPLPDVLEVRPVRRVSGKEDARSGAGLGTD